MKVTEIISDNEIEIVHGNSNFGSMSKRDVVKYAVLKYASGYHSGHTAKTILSTHKLLTKADNLSAKGKKYLWACFGYQD